MLIDYSYFIENYKFIAIDLSKHLTLNADPKVIQQINFTGNLGWEEGAWMNFILEEVKETFFSILNKERWECCIQSNKCILVWYRLI